jgi:hypothetical protein
MNALNFYDVAIHHQPDGGVAGFFLCDQNGSAQAFTIEGAALAELGMTRP